MKQIIWIILSSGFLLVSCKKENKNTIADKLKTKDTTVVDTINNPDISKQNTSTTCEDYLVKIVNSSNLRLKDYPEYFVRIENVENNKIDIKVYFENNTSDDPKIKQIVESTIAWLTFIPNEARLLNITADPENPIELKFDKNLITEELCNTCNVSFNKKNKNKSNRDCVTNELEMGLEEVCTIKKTSINEVYTSIIKNKEIDKSEMLQKKLPSKSLIDKIKSDGLIDIEYIVKTNKIEIIMSFDGGVSTILLEQIGENVKMTNSSSAD